jgi:HlyD family secretion protein
MKTEALSLSSQRAIRRHLVAGAIAVAVVTVGIGGLAATTELSGAVVASGFIVVESSVKKVQHPAGGIVGELKVRNGDRVKTGDLLVRLDDTMTRASLAIVVKSLTELSARGARLESERDGLASVVFPKDLLARAGNPDVDRVMTGEAKLFELRNEARTGQKSQLKERVTQLQEEIRGLIAQESAKAHEAELIKAELKAVRELWEKYLTDIKRLTQTEREAARIEGDRGRLIAAAAQAKGKITETELQILQLDQDLRSEVARELREIQAKSAELAERRVAAEDQLKRIELLAPHDGTVHQLQIHTVGGVIIAGEPVMLIVPDADALTVEARVGPQDVDQLRVGQPSVVRFPSFNLRSTPELNGTVSYVSADLLTDARTGLNYFLARIALPEQELARLGDVRLVPGTPVEAFVQTGARTVLSYLVKPIQDQAMRALRER